MIESKEEKFKNSNQLSKSQIRRLLKGVLAKLNKRVYHQAKQAK